jgi:transcriptional regulator with XRE-family HTH domain
VIMLTISLTPLRAARMTKGLTQIELGRRTRIDQATISALELGKRSPTSRQSHRLAAVLQTPAAELFPEEPSR